MAASSPSMFGLSDSEVKIALCGLKCFVADGKVDKNQLAALTGHANPDSANRVWYMVKRKIMETAPSPSAGPSASQVDVNTPTKGPKKTASKMRAQAPKKRAKKQADDEEDVDAEMDEQPAKRMKREAGNVTDLKAEDEI